MSGHPQQKLTNTETPPASEQSITSRASIQHNKPTAKTSARSFYDEAYKHMDEQRGRPQSSVKKPKRHQYGINVRNPAIPAIKEERDGFSRRSSDTEGSLDEDSMASRELKDPESSSSEFSSLSSVLEPVPSFTTNVERFRQDFDEIKCKMQIFGESLNLCNCIASDFRKRLVLMEHRLHGLEKEQSRFESNYTAIIEKNKKLDRKTKELAHLIIAMYLLLNIGVPNEPPSLQIATENLAC